MIKVIASESRSPAEYARRIEAWNAAEASPLPVAKLAKAYQGASPQKIARLIREAREERLEKRERLWTKMSRGLRAGIPDGVAKRKRCTVKDVDPKQLKIGTEVEFEHTSSRKLAREIALDHLCESPRYYRSGNVKQEHLLLKPGEYRKFTRKAGLGADVTAKQQRMFKRGVEAMRRALKGTDDPARAFSIASRGSKDLDFAAGVRTAFNLASPQGNRDAAHANLVKYGFKAG